jgi:hypothetical protein
MPVQVTPENRNLSTALFDMASNEGSKGMKMNTKIALFILFFLSLSSICIAYGGKEMNFKLPDGWKDLTKESKAEFDENAGTAELISAEHESGATFSMNYNSGVSLENEQMQEFHDVTFGRFAETAIYDKVINKNGVNWAWVKCDLGESSKRRYTVLLFRAFDGSPMNYTLIGNDLSVLDKMADHVIATQSASA